MYKIKNVSVSHPDVKLEIGFNDIEVEIQVPDSIAVDYPLNHTKVT